MTNPKLPPILINKAGSVYYVYTYKNVWDRELKRQLPAFFYSLPRGSLKTATVA